MSSLLQGHTKSALVFGAGTCLSAWLDLAAIRDVALHKAGCIFVIDFTNMIMAELTNFTARTTLSTPASLSARPIGSSLHELSP
jgi:hypothetical protein